MRLRDRFMKSPWGRLGISDEDVAAYYRKNDAVDANVPLQVAQRLLDDAANEFVSSASANAIDLARAQGVMQGIAMVALELAKVGRVARSRFAVAGGAGNAAEGGGE